MPFLNGGITAVQFVAEWPESFVGREVELLSTFSAEPIVIGQDGEGCGWTAGNHKRDAAFSDEKNVLGEFLSFDFRRTVDKLPGDLMRQYIAEELAEFQAINEGRSPTARQKREARERARERLEEEAKDGRFRKLTGVPVVWDRKTNRVWFASASTTVVDRFTSLFRQTFGVEISRIDSATFAPDTLKGLATEFIPGVTPSEYAWVADGEHPIHLGNEFALWLMWRANGTNDDEVAPGYVAMVTKTLTLECPRGQTGRETVTHEGPVRLPEVKKALQSGKLPTKLGLTLVRHQEQYEMTLAADVWVVSGGRVPTAGDGAPTEISQRKVYRLEAVRDLLATVNGLYWEFLTVRADAGVWDGEVQQIRQWLEVRS